MMGMHNVGRLQLHAYSFILIVNTSHNDSHNNYITACMTILDYGYKLQLMVS